jgi:hypothetical protein
MALQNTGYQGYKILKEQYTDDNTYTGKQMPNVAQVSPQAIVGASAVITFNTNANVVPSGGSAGDIWYNLPEDKLYKNIAGTWTILTDRVNNDSYVAPVYNTDACPLPTNP